MNPHDKNWRADLNITPDPETPMLRLFLTACFGAICFGAGVLYQQRQVIPLKSCVVQPKKAAMYESKGDVAYWRNYTRSLPK